MAERAAHQGDGFPAWRTGPPVGARSRAVPDRSARTKRLADLQVMAAHGLVVLSRVDREHLRQHLGGRPVGQDGAEMRLQPVQLRRRSAMRWPASDGPGNPSPGKHRHSASNPAVERRAPWPARRRSPVERPPATASLRPGSNPNRSEKRRETPNLPSHPNLAAVPPPSPWGSARRSRSRASP